MSSPNVSTDVLRTLHRIHRQLSDLNGRLQRGPKRIEAAQSHEQHREAQLAEAEQAARASRMASDAKQVQLKGGEDKVRELKLKLNTAASNREYQALKDQMAAQEMTNSVLADEILEGLEKLDEFQARIAEAKENLEKARQNGEAICAEVRQQEPLIRTDLTRLQSELAECEAALPIEIKEHYLRVIRQKGEDALAAVENQYCSGCNQHVPLNVCAEMMMGHPMFCRTCGRMLYMPEEGTANPAE
ncbi:MAG: phospholipase [Pirellulales bacterium]|nr:phospholipase [Pirellulales bacterium]